MSGGVSSSSVVGNVGRPFLFTHTVHVTFDPSSSNGEHYLAAYDH